jgi:hypothetical protein
LALAIDEIGKSLKIGKLIINKEKSVILTKDHRLQNS